MQIFRHHFSSFSQCFVFLDSSLNLQNILIMWYWSKYSTVWCKEKWKENRTWRLMEFSNYVIVTTPHQNWNFSWGTFEGPFWHEINEIIYTELSQWRPLFIFDWVKQARSEIKEDVNPELFIIKISHYLDVGKYNLSEDKIPNPLLTNNIQSDTAG